MKFFTLILSSLLFPTQLLAAELKPFTSDGCSIFPNGTLEQQSLWLNCCIKHDLAYWKGGTFAEKQQADQELKHCVSNVGEPKIANIMLAGVKVGGSAYLPTPYRWGYGWPYLRAYKALNDDEKKQISQQISNLTLLLNAVLKTVKIE